MYAVVDIAGKQFKVSENSRIMVPRLEGEVGAQVELDRVLLVSSDDGVRIGQPVLDKAKIVASILRHDRSKKILVFKKKRRKNYKVKRGHRQGFTEIQIDKIEL